MLKNSKLMGSTPSSPFEYKNSRKNIFSNIRQLINNQVILFHAELLLNISPVCQAKKPATAAIGPVPARLPASAISIAASGESPESETGE
jgi:hypothetical protein